MWYWVILYKYIYIYTHTCMSNGSCGYFKSPGKSYLGLYSLPLLSSLNSFYNAVLTGFLFFKVFNFDLHRFWRWTLLSLDLIHGLQRSMSTQRLCSYTCGELQQLLNMAIQSWQLFPGLSFEWCFFTIHCTYSAKASTIQSFHGKESKPTRKQTIAPKSKIVWTSNQNAFTLLCIDG